METRNIELPLGVRLRVQARSGRVLVVAEGREDVAVETDRVEHYFEDAGQTLVVRGGGAKPIVVRCPIDTDVDVGTHSGNVHLEGRFGSVHATTMSGNIAVGTAEDADLRTMSGKLTIDVCYGRCRLNSMSGSVTGGELESASASSVSGTIRLARVNGELRVRSVSGTIEVSACGDAPVAVKTVSGKVRITLPEGTEPDVHVHTRGRVQCELPPGRDCRIDAASLSGSIEVIAT